MAATCPRPRSALPGPGGLRGSKLERRSQLGELVRDRLAMGWSPEQIAGRLRRQAAQHEISHEFIDRWIYGPIGRRERLHRYLARAKPRRGRRPRAGRREPAILNRTPIHWRPAKASCRTEFGHWEADLMHFRRQRDALLTLQERTTRITLGGRLASKRAEPTMDQIVAKLAVLPKRARRVAPFTTAASGPDTSAYVPSSPCGPTSAIPTAPGSGAASRTPTACCVATSRGTPPCRTTAITTSMPCSGRSTPRLANASPSRPPWKPSLFNSVSHLKRESTVCLAGEIANPASRRVPGAMGVRHHERRPEFASRASSGSLSIARLPVLGLTS